MDLRFPPPGPAPDFTAIKLFAGVLAMISGVVFGIVALVLFRFSPVVAALITALDFTIGLGLIWSALKHKHRMQGHGTNQNG